MNYIVSRPGLVVGEDRLERQEVKMAGRDWRWMNWSERLLLQGDQQGMIGQKVSYSTEENIHAKDILDLELK